MLSTTFQTGRKLLLLLGIILGMTSCTAVENVTRLFASPSQHYVQEGDRLTAEDRQSEALLAYRQAVNLDGKNGVALRKLALAYTRQGRLRTAHQYLKRILALDPDNSEIRQELSASIPANPPEQPMRLAWQTELGEAPPSGIALDDQRIYAALEDGAVFALDRTGGELIWQTRLPAAATSAPATGEGLVIIGAQDGRLYALSSRDGRQVWSVGTHAPIYATPLVSGGRVFCSSSDSSLYAVSQSDGTVIWRYTTGSALFGNPALFDGILYFGSSDAHLYALNASDGSPYWPAGIPVQGPVQSTPLVFAGRVFFGSDDGRFYALATSSGGEYWRYSTSDAIYASAVFFQDTVIAASSDRTISALDQLSGMPRWKIQAEGQVNQAPLMIDSPSGPILLFITSASPWLYAVSPQTGGAAWKVNTGDWLSHTPLASPDGMVYLAGKDGTILAYVLH